MSHFLITKIAIHATPSMAADKETIGEISEF